MADWITQYLINASGKSSLEFWLDSLTHDQLKSVAKELKLLELCGNKLRLPHSKSLGKKLFELRERRYGFRIYYTFTQKKIIILLAAGKKEHQQQDIQRARKFLEQLLQNGEL